MQSTIVFYEYNGFLRGVLSYFAANPLALLAQFFSPHFLLAAAVILSFSAVERALTGSSRRQQFLLKRCAKQSKEKTEKTSERGLSWKYGGKEK